jgi:replication fork clamp-binding protein CrfC
VAYSSTKKVRRVRAMADKKKNRFSRPVAFNSENEQDQKRLKHIGRKAFSTYVKKLIDADMKAKGMAKEMREPQPTDEAPKKLTLDDLMEELKKAGAPASSSNKID